jgi:hypothetical protein
MPMGRNTEDASSQTSIFDHINYTLVLQNALAYRGQECMDEPREGSPAGSMLQPRIRSIHGCQCADAVQPQNNSEVLPDLPTVADFVPGYEASAWYGVGVPKGTPAEIVDRLNREINAILGSGS